MNLRPLALILLSASTALAQAGSPATSASPASGAALPHLQEVPFPQVKIDDLFFAQRRATNSSVTLRHALKQLEDTGTLGNFDLAAQGRREGFKGYVFQDSDAYKALEAT